MDLKLNSVLKFKSISFSTKDFETRNKRVVKVLVSDLDTDNDEDTLTTDNDRSERNNKYHKC